MMRLCWKAKMPLVGNRYRAKKVRDQPLFSAFWAFETAFTYSDYVETESVIKTIFPCLLFRKWRRKFSYFDSYFLHSSPPSTTFLTLTDKISHLQIMDWKSTRRSNRGIKCMLILYNSNWRSRFRSQRHDKPWSDLAVGTDLQVFSMAVSALMETWDWWPTHTMPNTRGRGFRGKLRLLSIGKFFSTNTTHLVLGRRWWHGESDLID